MLRHPAIRILFLALLVWGILSFLLKYLGLSIVLILILLAALAALTAWMLRNDRTRLAKAYKYPVCKQFIDLICKITKYQPPVEGASEKGQPEEQLLLKDALEFHRAAERLQRVVRGHGPAITRLTDRLHSAVLLRAKIAQQKGAPPLATFVLVGPPGIGKKYLAVKLGRMLYKKPAVLYLSMRDYSDEKDAVAALFGIESKAGLILTHVKSKPHHIIILDDVHLAAAAVVDRLSQVMAHGMLVDPSTGAPVSFQHCVFFLITHRAADALGVLPCEKAASQRDWMRLCQEALSMATPLDLALVNHVTDFVLFRSLDRLTRAEIILQLVLKECKKYDLKLEHIDPELLAAEVAVVNDERGLELSPARVERLLRDPMVRAAKTNAACLSLRHNQITMVQPPELIKR